MNRWAAFFLMAVVVALALRLPDLDNRPMHNDEAVNAIKFKSLWEQGEYKYDPHEYHGPTLHYLTAALSKLTGAPDFQSFSEFRLRLLTVIAGVALVLALLLVRDALVRDATVAAGLFTAISPVMVFFSRYWIHEMLLVLFSFLAIGCAWRFLQKPSWLWAGATGLALGLMQATKETFVLALAAAAGALVVNWAWQKFQAPSANRERLPFKCVLVALGAWLLVWITMFSSFFHNAAGLLDSIRTYQTWLGHAGGDSIHAQPWSFYLERLFWFHPKGGPIWSEGLLLVLAVIGGASAFRRTPAASGNGAFIRFLTIYTVLLAAVYSTIPYKTPWCVLGFMHGIILLAGVGAATVWRARNGLSYRAAVTVLLGLGCAHLGWQAWRASFPLCADRANPWAYAQTSPDLLKLVSKVNSVASMGQGNTTMIKIVGEDGDYWPLPWYLRAYPNTGWWDDLPPNPKAPIVITSARLQASLDMVPEGDVATHVMVGYFELRPQVFLELYVELGLWKDYLAGKGSAE